MCGRALAKLRPSLGARNAPRLGHSALFIPASPPAIPSQLSVIPDGDEHFSQDKERPRI